MEATDSTGNSWPRWIQLKKRGPILLVALIIKVGLLLVAFFLPVSMLGLLGVSSTEYVLLSVDAPEVWLSLLALVFGTLIIVVSIASENTPKLIDMFVGDPRGRLYIWLIMLSSLENIYLQIFSSRPDLFLSNLIFINSFVLFPLFVFFSIPYTYYILKYTKNANVIDRIFQENRQTLMMSYRTSAISIQENHRILFETINQLHDLLQYIQFKEPKGDIIISMGRSVRMYLGLKQNFPDAFFKLDSVVRNDISFRTLIEKYERIEKQKTFYELKVFRVLGTTYLSLMNGGHYELASLCGNELFETGKVAIKLNDQHVINMVIVHFNTLLRYGINQGLKTREIRNVYNTIYHYSHLILIFINRREENRVRQCCQYLGLYAKEAARLSLSDPLFVFMIEVISWELKKLLVLLNEEGFSRELQKTILISMTALRPVERRKAHWQRNDHNGVRLIQIALCLHYLNREEHEYCNILVETMTDELKDLSLNEAKELIMKDCNVLSGESEEFWEETDQGNMNIFYSPDKGSIPKFKACIFAHMEQFQGLMSTS